MVLERRRHYLKVSSMEARERGFENVLAGRKKRWRGREKKSKKE